MKGLNLKIYKRTELTVYIPDISAHEPDIPAPLLYYIQPGNLPAILSSTGPPWMLRCTVIITWVICRGSLDSHKPNCISHCRIAKITLEYIKGSLILEFSSTVRFLGDLNQRRLFFQDNILVYKQLHLCGKWRLVEERQMVCNTSQQL